MSYCSVTISSVNLSGQTVDVTFYPEGGGMIYLGPQVFPFTYVSNNPYGTYACYSATYDYIYTIEVPSNVTPTPTSTVTPTPTITPITPTPTVTSTQTPTVTPTITSTVTPGLSPTATPTIPETPTPTITSTITPTPTITPTIPSFSAYIFAEPQDSTSSNDLGQFMYDNGSINFFGFANSGVPSVSNYNNDLIVYASYPGFITGSTGNFITPVTSLTSYIRQFAGAGLDSFGCVQNRYTFGTIQITTTDVNPNVDYFYSIWIPLAGVGGSMNNMTVDITLGSACDGSIVSSSYPSPSLAAINVNIPSGCAIPAGIYRVLWMPVNGLQPPGLPMESDLYFKGNSKI